MSYASRGLRNLTDHFQTSRRVNPQKRVLEKTRQKSVGPAEKKTKADSDSGSRVVKSNKYHLNNSQKEKLWSQWIGYLYLEVQTYIKAKAEHHDNFLSKTCVKNSETVNSVVLIFHVMFFILQIPDLHIFGSRSLCQVFFKQS